MNRIGIFTLILIAVILIGVASATSVDRLFMCNLEGHPGDTITQNITLTGTLPDRTGHWRTTYKQVEGDDAARMDIRSWITITPQNYTLKQGEEKTFIVEIKIPKDAQLGLYGATSLEAGLTGHSGERRTYIIFEDANTTAVIQAQGSVAYAGSLIPISVNVIGKPNPLTPFIQAVQVNIISILLVAIVIVLLVLLLRRRK